MKNVSSRFSVPGLGMAFLLVLVCLLIAPALVSVTDGAVRGRVTIHRKVGANFKPKADHSGAVVFVAGYATAPPAQTVKLVQRGRSFEPEILPVVRGQVVEFPNLDEIYHNVFSISRARNFDLGLYKKWDPPRKVKFDNLGLVQVYCNIHPEMQAAILVLENDAFAETRKDGSFHMDNVRPGTHEIRAWCARGELVREKITVVAGKETVVNLSLHETLPLVEHKRKDGTDYPSSHDDTPFY
ncbi:MAG: hypothetical protein HYU64_05220 [Armatimonadetes bacterium]|nr:hypothetical protein [Armatimonadota bacterium]